MFTPEIVNFRQFYATPFGEAVRALITTSLKDLWPQAKDEMILGIGYSTPYLESYVGLSSPVMICMPAQQGAAYWPASGDNRVFLAHESQLPLPENSVNRILLVHSVENSEQLSWMIDEVWRVLTPGGRVLAIVPNRLGAWARSSRSPFGHGRPFSIMQLRDLLIRHQFTLTRTSSALFTPPTYIKLVWRFAPHLEKLGKWFCPFLGGVLMVEAEKQLYAAIRQPVASRKAYTLPLPVSNPALGLKS